MERIATSWHQLLTCHDTPPPRPPQGEEQRGTQRNSWGLLVCATCFRPSIKWGWPACRLTAVHISPLCSTSPNALGALSLCYVFQTEYRVGMASLPPDSSPHLATLQHLPQRPPHRGEQRGPQRKSWGLVFSYSSVSCFRSNREWGWPACRLTAVRTSPFCAHPPPPSSQRGAARPQPNRWKLVSCRIVQSCLASCHCRAEYHV